MAPKKRKGRAKKNPNSKLSAGIQLKGKQIPSATVQATTANQSTSEKTFKVETLSQRRSNRIGVVRADRGYLCKICNWSFPNESNLKRHLGYYGDPKFSCKECKTKFTHRSQVQTHVTNAHRNPGPKFTLRCRVCNQMFMKTNQLQAHFSHYHEAIKAIDDMGRHQTEVDVMATESPELVKDSASPDGETSLLLKPEMESSIREDTVTDGDQKIVENPETAPIGGVELSESIDKGIPPVSICAVLNKENLGNVDTDVPQQQRVEISCVNSSVPENNVLQGASLNEAKIELSTTDFQETLRDSDTGESHHEVHNYAKEAELRRLYSCKDCYVPLMRVNIPEPPSEKETRVLTQSKTKEYNSVIPSVVCDQKFSTKETMFQHYKLVHFTYTNDQVHCVCGKQMDGDEELQSHFYRHCQKTIPSATTPADSEMACIPLEQKLACRGCDKKFWLESCLRSHVYDCKSFIGQKVTKILTKGQHVSTTTNCNYVCPTCRTTFRSRKKMAAHEKLYSRKPEYRCVSCETMFYGFNQRRAHTATAHEPITKQGYDFECTICGQRFNSRRLERIHRMHIHQEASILSCGNLSPPDSDDPGDEVTIKKCYYCNIEFSNTKRFIDHMIYYMTSETIYCKTCGKKFKGQYQAHCHNKTVHYSKEIRNAYTHHCGVCNEGFMYMTHLQAHMCHVHMTEPNDSNADKNYADSALSSCNACSVCNVKFSSPALLSAHEADFGNDCSYMCNRCPKKFSTVSAILNHLNLNHSNNALQGGFKCRRCNENFLTPSSWVSHVKHVHSPSEPSEFYFEKNVVSIEKSEDIRYELIPTNKSISSGQTYLKVKNAIKFSTKPMMTYPNEQADEQIFMTNNIEETEITGVNDDQWILENETSEEEAQMIRNSDKISKDGDEQEANSKLNSDADKTEVKSLKKAQAVIPENLKATEPKSDWHCDICGYRTHGPALLAKHWSFYSDNGQHMCEICGRRFEVYANYQTHKLSHLNYDVYEFACTCCNEGFQMSRELKMHNAHLHPDMPSESPTCTSVTLAHKPEEWQETSKEAENLARKRNSSLYGPSLPTSPKPPMLRTYSIKPCKPTGVLPVQNDPSNLEQVKATAPSHPDTEIIEAKIPMIYECSNCQEKFSSIKRLSEHLTTVVRCSTVQKINQTRDQLETKSTLLDAPVKCDVCEKVFANTEILNDHRDKIHYVNSGPVSKGPVPVLQITVPINRSKNPNDTEPVVIGRLYKLEQISNKNAVPKPVNDSKNKINKQITVTRIVGTNVEQQKPLLKSTVKIKANAAVRLKPPFAAPVPLTGYAAAAKNLKTLLTPVEKTQPPSVTLVSCTCKHSSTPKQTIANATLRPKSVVGNPAEQLKSVTAPLKPLAGNTALSKTLVGKSVLLKRSVGNVVKVLPLKSPIKKVVQPKPPVQGVVKLEPVDDVVQFDAPVEEVVKLEPVDDVVNFDAPVEEVVKLEPVDDVVKFDAPVEEVVQPNSLCDKRMILQMLNMGQVDSLKLGQQTNMEQQKTPELEENPLPFRITSVYSENPNFLETTILDHSKPTTSFDADTLSPSTLFTSIEKVKVEPCSEITSTTSSIHPSTSLNVQSAGKLSTDGTSVISSLDQLRRLVSRLPAQTKIVNDTEDQVSFSFDFESVFMPVSDNDYGQMVEDFPINVKLAEPVDEIDPPSGLVEKKLSSENSGSAPMKIQPVSIIANTAKRKTNPKRKADKSKEMLPEKRSKEMISLMFDPAIYEELCRQHNLVPKRKSPNSRPAKRTPKK